MLKVAQLFLVWIILVISIIGQKNSFPQIDLETTGAKLFLQKHPEYDGRGVLLIILDSGVDVGVEGLLKTSDGKTKILDVRDFTGEGDLSYSPVQMDTTERGKIVFKISGQVVYGAEEISEAADSTTIYGGSIPEYRFRDSRVEDLNRDGDTEDEFAFVVYTRKKDGRLVCRIDLNGDHHLEDEQEIQDYADAHQYFSFAPVHNNENKVPPHFALKIYPNEGKINLFFDGNGHGTHVAGIAAGFRINGEEGYNGVAPGAQIIACKIGDSRKSGGATVTGSMKKAIDFGVQMAKKLNMPAVFNMSYGVGSLLEGEADDEEYLNRIFSLNRDLVFCSSNGNSGPGISSAGSPAVAEEIISSGALFSVKNAAATYSLRLASDKVFSFSSRGGDMMKPDILAPGSAASTVPDFSYGDRMWGTSMASPNTAGSVALLLSAFRKENIQVVNSLIKRALINSAKSLKHYQLFDQGGGIINIPEAYRVYKKLVKRVENNLPIQFHISNSKFIQAKNKLNGFLWRNGVESLKNAGIIRVDVQPEYLNSKTRKTEHYRLFSSAGWLQVQASHVYTRKGHPFSFSVKIKDKYLKKPGVYSAKVYGIPVDKKAVRENIVFETWFTVVIPYIFDSKDHHTLRFEKKKLYPGDIHRYFVYVPTGASHLKIQLSNQNSNSNCRVYVFNPDGEKVYTSGYTGNSGPQYVTLEGSELNSGVYEINVLANYTGPDVSVYNLVLKLRSYELANQIMVLNYNERPEFRFSIQNGMNDYFKGKIEGSVNGFYRKEKVGIKGSDTYSYRIHVPLNCSYLALKFSVPEEDFIKLTDLSLILTDDRGETVVNTSLDFNTETIYARVEPDRYYYLEIYGAFFDESLYNVSWAATLEQYFYLDSPIPFSVENDLNYQHSYFLPPHKYNHFSVLFETAPVIKPDGFLYWGDFKLKEQGDEDIYKLRFYMK